MGLNFRKSIKIAKGIRLNLSKSGASVTLGPKGLHYTISTTGRQTASASLPGTGLYYTKTLSSGKKKSSSSKKTSAVSNTAENNRGKNVRSSSQMRQEREARAAALAQEQEALEIAAAQVEEYEAYTHAITHVHLECREAALWEEDTKLDADACLQIIQESDLFGDLVEYGCNFEIGTEDGETVEVEFQAMISEVVPTASLSLTKNGTVKETALTKTAYYAMVQDYVCSSSLRIAREVFALLPVNQVKVHVTDTAVNTANGCEEEFTILSVTFDRSRMDRIRFEYIDASDCVSSFPCNMNFGKTSGFKKVERV